MKKSQLLSAAVSGLFFASTSFAQTAGASSTAPTAAAGDETCNCAAFNSCKGQGECGGKGHECAGKNSCKGKGWKKVSKAECDAAHKKDKKVHCVAEKKKADQPKS